MPRLPALRVRPRLPSDSRRHGAPPAPCLRRAEDGAASQNAPSSGMEEGGAARAEACARARERVLGEPSGGARAIPSHRYCLGTYE